MAAMDGFRRILGLRVEADERAKEVLESGYGSEDPALVRGVIMSTQSMDMPASQILAFLPGLGDDAMLPQGVQRQAAVMMEAARVMKAHVEPRADDRPLDGAIRKKALDNVKGRTDIFMGGGLEQHLARETKVVDGAVEGFLSTGPARDRSYALEAAALHPDVVGRRPELTVQDIERHIRMEAAKALTGNLSEKTGEREAAWIVSQATVSYAKSAISQAGVMTDPLRKSHVPTTDQDWIGIVEARQATRFVTEQRASPAPASEQKQETPAASRDPELVPIQRNQHAKAAMTAAHSAMGR